MKQSDFRRAPVALKKPVILEKFGVERTDNYFWIKEKENKEVINYLHAENEYTDEVMASTKELQSTIFEEIKGRIKEEDESYPYPSNGYYYYTRTIKGKEYPEYLRKKGSLDAEEEMIFDVNDMAKGHKAFIFEDYDISFNNKLAAYAYNTTGSFAEYQLKIRDLERNEDLDIMIDGVASFVFSNDNNILFYTKIDSTLRPFAVYRYDIEKREETVVYEETDGRFIVFVSIDKLRKYIYISSSSSTTTEERFVSADHPLDEFKVFMERKQRVEYNVHTHSEGFFIKYKDDDNINSKVYKTSFDKYQDKNLWTEVIAHHKDISMESLLVFEDFITTVTRENGLKKINILQLENNETSSITFPEASYDVEFGVNKEFKTRTVRYFYDSLKRPTTLYNYDVLTKESKILKVQEIPSGFNSDDYEVERVMVKATDGKEIPLSILYKKGLERNGENKTLLYSYGSYGANSEAYFRASVFSLVDRGFVYAVAQIRGGSEMGKEWYEDGKMLHKKNTFTDFIRCSEYLIDKGYTSNKKLSIMGGSAGGLLMGAVINMRPDLYQSVLSLVPFVDVVTTMLDESLPLTIGEYEEWGNPNEEEYFNYMLSYSPYDNIEEKDYPNILVTGGLNDSQVLYHEPTKYVAKLRGYKTDDNLLLLHMNMDSGHGGGTGRYERLKDTAFYYSFLLKTI